MLFKNNATLIVTENQVYTGQDDPVTKEPIFTQKSQEYPIWVNLKRRQLMTEQGVGVWKTRIDGRLDCRFNIRLTDEKVYELRYTTDNHEEVTVDFQLESVQQSVLGTTRYFGINLEGFILEKESQRSSEYSPFH